MPDHTTTPDRTVVADRFEGFVHADGGRLLDGTGRPLLMRGVGLGNWLLPEGYMWRFEGGPQSPRQIEALITDLVGPTQADDFWREFQDAFITEADIIRIAAEGFDHVRLPINSRVVMDEDGTIQQRGLELIDRTIGWCRTHGLWVILDLHGAPGGQTGTNIDDSPRGRPELFEVDLYRAQTITLWRALAERYATETVVAGYDLLNEPLPNEWQDVYADRLVALYRDLTTTIREVDPHHLIIYEGTHWSTNWSIFTEVWDTNSMLQFHKYWSAPDLPSIAPFIETGRALGLPIYMGEGGENNTDWLQTAFQLYEDHDISWNFWPWKKIDTHTSPCSVNPPTGWDDVVAYGAGTGPRPDKATSVATLSDLIGAMKLDSCVYQREVVNALLRRAPLRIPATGFGFRGPGRSYEARSGNPLAGFRSDDVVTIRFAGGQQEPKELPFHHTTGTPRTLEESLEVVLEPGDWVAYSVEIRDSRLYSIDVDTDGDGEIEVLLSGAPVVGKMTGEGRWHAHDLEITPGDHEIRVVASTGQVVLAAVGVSLRVSLS